MQIIITMLLSKIDHRSTLDALLGSDTKIDNLIIMEDGLIDHKKNLRLFLDLSLHKFKFPNKIQTIFDIDRRKIDHIPYNPSIYQLIVFLMSNGNKRISSLFPINHRTKYQFKILRTVGFSIIESETGKILYKNAKSLNYKNLTDLLTKSGQIKYFRSGAIVPKMKLPKQVWVCLSNKKIQSILSTIKKEKTPIAMACRFVAIVTNYLNLSDTTRKKRSPHAIFTKQCNQIYYYQNKKGGLIYKYPHQKHLSAKWAFKMEYEFQTGNHDALETTIKYIQEDLSYLILPSSVFWKQKN